jgi:hypothetical protein
MILKKVRGNLVDRMNTKPVICPSYREILIYPERQLVQKHVTIRAKAQDVFCDIRPIMGTPKGLDVAAFCIRACHRY